jgi:transcription antitermination factor NusA-like protein
MVKTILDAFCIKSGILCRKCQEKIEKGQITDLDLKIIRLLSDLEKTNQTLQDVTYHKAVEVDGNLAILVDRRDMSKILSGGAKAVHTISDSLGKKVKILGYGGDDRQFLEDLFSPLSILTLNTIWIPDGSTETKVILTGRQPRRMPVDLEIVRKLAKQLRNMTLRIEFEKL